jgi:hypothetical protein
MQKTHADNFSLDQLEFKARSSFETVKALKRSRDASSNDHERAAYSVAIAQEEKKYKKLVLLIAVVKCQDTMKKADKLKILKVQNVKA